MGNLQTMYNITLKQRTDGKIRVSSVYVSNDIYEENPFIKEQIKNAMEKKLEENGIKVLKDKGVVQFN